MKTINISVKQLSQMNSNYHNMQNQIGQTLNPGGNSAMAYLPNYQGGP